MDPRRIVDKEKHGENTKLLNHTLDMMVDAKRMKDTTVDLVVSQYNTLCSTVLGNGDQRELLRTFSSEDDRLDSLMHGLLSERKQYADLWAVIKQLLLLSHGQASVERGFSVNKEVTVENMKEHTLVACRQIAQHVHTAGGVDHFPVTKELLLHASGARKKYQDYLDKICKEAEDAEKGRKRKAEDAVADLRAKKMTLERDIQHLRTRAEGLYESAERLQQLPLLSEANALKHKATEKEKAVKALEQEIIVKKASRGPV
jgi:hypothetical protein